MLKQLPEHSIEFTTLLINHTVLLKPISSFYYYHHHCPMQMFITFCKRCYNINSKIAAGPSNNNE